MDLIFVDHPAGPGLLEITSVLFTFLLKPGGILAGHDFVYAPPAHAGTTGGTAETAPYAFHLALAGAEGAERADGADRDAHPVVQLGSDSVWWMRKAEYEHPKFKESKSK
jgi:hypothetical protein